MDINLLLQGVDCSCGRRHTCAIDKVFIEHGAEGRLTSLCAKYTHILIVADENTYSAAGEKTEEALGGKKVSKVIFDGGKILIPNEDATQTVEENLNGADLIVGIGSGVIQDLCKYVSHRKGVDYIIVATAPSMDGYASSGAAMILNGMKETVPAGVPKAIVADTEVLKDAPMDMICAGYGDIVGKFSALNDWRLSHAVNGEYFCDYIYSLTHGITVKTLSLADGIKNRDEQSVGVLMEALVTVGILMSFAGSSRPASGSEHHLSHFFEITGIVDGKRYLPHGIDVAFSTVVTARIREKLLKSKFPPVRYTMEHADYAEKMRSIYKSVADGCMQLQEKVGNYSKDRTEIYLEKEDEIKKILADMPKSCEIQKMLAAVGLNMNDFYGEYGIERINNAVKYAKDLKDRYTVLWLNYDVNGGKYE